jgi:hypothetical protein
MTEHNVLFIACGGTKRPTQGRAVPALELYAGRQFGLARKLEALGWTVVVISAKHGLVASYRDLEDYDCRMTAERSEAAVANIRSGRSVSCFQYAAATAGASRVVFYGGADYFRIWDALHNVAGPRSFDDAGQRACEVEQIIGQGCGEHYSVLAAIVREAEAAAAAVAA